MRLARFFSVVFALTIVAGATVHLVRERRAETHVRALLPQALAGSGLTSTGRL